MTRGRIEFEPAWLLARRPYRESSVLLEVLTRHHGRVGLVARGARGPKSKQRGVLEPFRPLLLSWVESGELGTMTAAEAAGAEIALSGERIFHGWYLNELLLKLLQRHDPHEAIHDDYAAALAGIAGDEAEAEAALRIFEKRLLEQLGYGLPLDDAFDPALSYRYVPGIGFDASAADERTAGQYSGAALIALRDESWPTRELLREALRLLRTALAAQLGGRALETPKLLRAVRQLSDRET